MGYRQAGQSRELHDMSDAPSSILKGGLRNNSAER